MASPSETGGGPWVLSACIMPWNVCVVHVCAHVHPYQKLTKHTSSDDECIFRYTGIQRENVGKAPVSHRDDLGKARTVYGALM
jgi:hypothetical protein